VHPGGRVLAFEPQPELFAELEANARLWRERYPGVAVETSSCALSAAAGTAELVLPPSFATNRGLGSLARPASGERSVTVRTVPLDEAVPLSVAPALLKIDVEGHELDVLRGFDTARWRPQLILLEDHVADLSKHRALRAAGYRIVRRYENNGWYVPRGSAVQATLSDRWEIVRKYYLALPFRFLRNLSRRLRKGQG
jgi:FkbM family methyltransferase